jgi:ATP-binding cassette subfamily F protein 3
MLVLNNIIKKFGARTVLKDLSYNFPNSKIIALIGSNGSGKSTLLNIICNLDEADDGTISKPKEMAIGYLPQEPNPNPKSTILDECMSGSSVLYKIRHQLEAAQKKMEENFSMEVFEEYEKLESQFRLLNGYAFEAEASKILAGLGFKEDQSNLHPTTLSGGWRMRLELAKLLLNKPDLLILDEPTNHLDLPSIIWLEKYLTSFEGSVLFVSHDEDFLRKLPQIVLHLKDGKLTEYQGNFDDFLAKYQEIQESNIKAMQGIDRQIKHAAKFVERFRYKASKARQAQSRLKMITRLEEQASGIEIDTADQEIAIKIPLKIKSSIEVMHLTDCDIGYDIPLIKAFSLFIERGQKIAIVGANGMGKSTMLKSIGDIIPILKGDVKLGHNVRSAYYSQDQLQALNLRKSALENLLAINPNLSTSQARNFLGSFLLKGDHVFQEAEVLSGGEKSRLGLACLLAQDANLLLLDEPTNHLDMASTEVLAEALGAYEGTVLFISHNRRFINSFATHIIAINARGKAKLFYGNLEDSDVEEYISMALLTK